MPKDRKGALKPYRPATTMRPVRLLREWGAAARVVRVTRLAPLLEQPAPGYGSTGPSRPLALLDVGP